MSKHIIAGWIIVALALGLASCTGSKPNPNKAPAASPGSQVADTAAKSGADLFKSAHCSGCHMINGEGGSKGPDLSHVAARLTAEQISSKIRNPKAMNPNALMPDPKLPDQQIGDLAAYLSTLK